LTESTKSAPAPTPSWSARTPSAATTQAARPLRAAARRARRPRAAGKSHQGHTHQQRDLDPAVSFLAAGQASKIVYASSPAVARTREQLADVATVVDAGEPLSLPNILADLAARGVRRLMVEGGAMIHRQFLTAGLADEIHLVIAPFFVGDPAAPRFPGDGAFPHPQGNRMELAEIRQIGDVVLLRYLLHQATGD
jgi:5-amino-6-(5-phosphoribosylamino)uracil reductase